MERDDAEKAIKCIREFHSKVISPLLNSSSLVVGSTYDFDIDVPGIENGEFEVRPFGTAASVSATRPQAPNSRWSLKVFPSDGSEPFRIEEDNCHPYAHVNTKDPEYKNVKLKIPTDTMTTYGIIGSAVGGYYDPDCDIDLAELLRRHVGSE